jgi:prolyl oligopeptidase
MGILSPPPRPIEPKPEDSGKIPVGSILYGATFLLAAAFIFAVTIKPQTGPASVTSTAPSPTANPPPIMPKLPLTYPASRIVDASDTYFHIKVADPYRWLEDGKSPEVKAWLDAQNNLARSYLDALPGRDALHQRYHDLFYIDTISAPERAGDRLFYLRKKATDEKAILYWRSTLDPQASENVLVDPNQFIATNNAALGDWVPAHDGGLLAYTLRPDNADEATLYVKDVTTGKDIPGQVIDGAKYASPSWLPDGSGFVYTWLPPAVPGHVEDRPGLAVIKFHQMWTDPKNDPIIHGKTGDATQFIGADISRDGKWIFFQVGNWARNDLYYQPLDGKPTADLADSWRPLVVGKPYLYDITAWKGQGYILTNEDAPHYRLFKTDLTRPRRSHWHEIVPESPTTVLRHVDVVGGCLVLDELEKVTSQVEIRDLDGSLLRKLTLPELGSVVQLSGDMDHDELYYGFVNFTHPLEIFKTSVTDATQTSWAKIQVPVDPSPYVVEQKFFPSKDGTSIPMFIVHRKDIVLDGRTPFLLYGYGGFGVSLTPVFSSGIYPWLEAGGGFALVNLRGGGEFGEKWHQDGMLLKKQNVFDDCIAAAEYLVKQGYTKPERLALRGGSNGGLLAGAMLTQRPDLFRAIVCEVPLLDMVRFAQFASGKTWVPEYGSPQDEAQFKALYAYSPYHHVKPGTAYPSVLFCTAADDDRVDPMHARKMAAELQAATSGPHPILLRVESQSGHGGGDQVKKGVEANTDVWGFLIHELGAQVPQAAENPSITH